MEQFLFNFHSDADVGFVMNGYDVIEDAGAVDICIDSGVTEGFQTDLTVSLSATDGTACEGTFRSYWLALSL